MIAFNKFFAHSGLRFSFLSVSLVLMGFLTGCSSSSTEKGKEEPVAEQKDPEKDPAKQDSKVKPKQEEPAGPTPAELWKQQVSQVDELIKADKLSEAEEALQGFRTIYTLKDGAAETASTGPTDAEKVELSELITRVNSRRAELAAENRIAYLTSAKDAFEKQEYNEATDAINELLAISPTDAQREQAMAMRTEIERILARQRELRTFVRMLGSEDPHNVSAGEKRLGDEPDVALSLLLEAVKDQENLILVRNALVLMRRMKRPDVALPAMVGVLAREEQKASWEDAVREISRMDEPGAGEPLLELVKTSQNPEQRAAALQSLVAVVDPPAETQVALLPLVMKDGPELAQALRALHRSVRVHGTYDAAAGRNLDVPMTEEQAAQWEKLPARLTEIMAAGEVQPESEKTEADQTEKEFDYESSAPYQAKVLAMATRQLQPEVLPVAKVSGVSKEMDDGLAPAVLDGVWNSLEYPTQWRQPIATEKDTCFIELDLGQTRTVMGVRIWNFNELNGTHRGWKGVDVFVSDKPRALEPVSSGMIPMAPGVAETPEAVLPDYSTFIPVDFVRGRYVKLQAQSVWRVDGHAGLAEVQVIGF